MDEELTEEYSEPCGQCGAVSWALSEGLQYFCRNCHNVIERTHEVVDVSTYLLNNRISTISGSRKKSGTGRERDWMVCEGFQFILKHQAEALVGLGVCPQFKTHVLWDFWKRYLQKTRQAYTRAPVNSMIYPASSSLDQSSGSEPESAFLSEASEQRGAESASGYSSDGKSSVCSGSLDASFYFSVEERKSRHLMNMPRTLALCHLALLWLREAVTLSDLLRLVSKKLVPYINVHEHFPEQMKFFGRDALIFRVESIPSYSRVQKEAMQLARLLQLQSFPRVTKDCLLHPALLSMRYLMDANLPDELHPLVCEVIEKTAIGKDCFLTLDPARPKSRLRCYDIQAAALIIVTMKLLFRLNDQHEWMLSRKVDQSSSAKKKSSKQGIRMFNLKRWYMTVQLALEKARKREEMFVAKRQWKSSQPVIPSLKHKTVVLKRRRVVEQLQNSFQVLSGGDPEQPSSPSSFLFRWGTEDGSDGPSLQHESLSYVLKKEGKYRLLLNQKYWHTDLSKCRDHFHELEPSLPRMYMWLLGLFSFILGVSEAQVHSEVIKVEGHLLGKTFSAKDDYKPQRKRRKTS